MEKFTKEIIDRIDENNMKAGEILKSILKIVDDESETINIAGIDLVTLIEAASDLITQNNTTFISCK